MGHPKEDVMKLMSEGLFCDDKFFLFEKLNGLKYERQKKELEA